MSKKPQSKGTRPEKITDKDDVPKHVPASIDRSDDARDADVAALQAERLAALMKTLRYGFPLIGVAVAIVASFTHGLAMAVLLLIGTALLTTVASIWTSLQVLAGDRDDTLDGAVPQGVSGAESEQKGFLLRALKDLEFERSLGKIGEEDYEELKQRYRARAKEVLQDIDRRNEPAREKAEAMAAEWLRSHGLPTDSESPGNAEPAENNEPSASDAAPVVSIKSFRAVPERRICAACAVDNEPDASFCKKCGKSIDDDATAQDAARSEQP